LADCEHAQQAGCDRRVREKKTSHRYCTPT
jgi:hypothetical protein